MGNHDHNIIGRAFEYYNNREENKYGQLDVKAYHKLTRDGLLAAGGIYQDMQWRKNTHTVNNQILGAIFMVLKEAVDTPGYIEKLKTQKDVYKAIERHLGKLKGKVQTHLTEILTASQPPKKVTEDVEKSVFIATPRALTVLEDIPMMEQSSLEATKILEAESVLTLEAEPVTVEDLEPIPTPVSKTPKTPRLPKEERLKSYFVNPTHTKKTKKKGPTPTNGNASSKIAVSKPPIIVVQKDVQKNEKKSDSFVVNPEYASLLDNIKKARTREERKDLSLKLFAALTTDTEKYGFQNDIKTVGFKHRIQKFIKENSFDTALEFELKFFAFRIEQLGKEKQ